MLFPCIFLIVMVPYNLKFDSCRTKKRLYPLIPKESSHFFSSQKVLYVEEILIILSKFYLSHLVYNFSCQCSAERQILAPVK